MVFVSTSFLFCLPPLSSVPSFPQLCPPPPALAEQFDPQMCTGCCYCRQNTSRKKRLCCPWNLCDLPVRSCHLSSMTQLGCLAYCLDLVTTNNCLLWFECEMSPGGSHLNTRSSAWSSGWKAVEPLRGGALMEEVGHQRWALRFYSLALLPVSLGFLSTGSGTLPLGWICLPCLEGLYSCLKL